MLGTSRRDGALSIPVDHCRIELVGLVPALRVALERRDHLRKRIAQAVLRLPAEKLACPVDIEDIMVVARLDHPRLDRAFSAEHLILHPCPGLRDRLRNPDCAPPLERKSTRLNSSH